MAMTEWRIDAWAVRDGAAFASRRATQSRMAENTIFVAVPDLEPVPVGRMSTALAATRRNFQAGLYGTDGEEVAFQTVDQIIELVRRGFLAGGLGPGGSAAPLPPGGPPLPPAGLADWVMREPVDLGSSRGGAHFEHAIRDDHLVTWRDPEQSVTFALEHLGRLAQKAGESVGSALWELIAVYAEATVIDWEQRVGLEDDPVDVGMLLDWYGALYDVGIWMNGRSLAGFVSAERLYWGRQFLDGRTAPSRRGEGGPETAPSSRRQLISCAPCPRRPDWVLGLSRLADKLTLPMCIGNYFDANRYLPELAPATLAAMLITGYRFPPASLSGGRYRERRLDVALRWLAGETPGVELPKMAEELINAYAWSCVEGTAGRRGPAAAAIPAPLPA